LDEVIRTRFSVTLAATARCELFAWRATPRAFAQAALALAQRSFAYMPYMHSESALVRAQAVVLFDQPGMEDTLRFEMRHQAIIERFGRYPPHRNAILGRESNARGAGVFE
jgi:uncharacterized protein (DUF924 family)